MLPDLLRDTRHVHHAKADEAAAAAGGTADLLVRVYRLAALVLVKLGEADLAWLAAVLRTGPIPADVSRLVTAIGLTHQ